MASAAPPLLPEATRRLVEFAAGLCFGGLSRAVLAQARLALLGGIGACPRSASLPWTRMVLGAAR